MIAGLAPATNILGCLAASVLALACSLARALACFSDIVAMS